MAKGKRELVLEIGELQTDVTELKKIIDKSLKAQGVKTTEDVKIYFNTSQGIAYCVTTTSTYKVVLNA